MKLIPIERIPNKCGTKTDNYAILQEFIAMDVPCAEIQHPPYKNVGGGATSLNRSAKHFGFAVKAVSARGRLFLQRLPVEE